MKDLLYPLRKLHGRIHEWRVNVLPLYLERLRNPRAVYLVLTPEHGNLGDHAIAQSEIEILRLLKIPYIEVTDHRIEEWKKQECLHVMNGRVILIHGGGNLGSLWPSVEKTMEQIVRDNPKSSVIFFPNTIFYGKTREEQELFVKSKQLYNSHDKLKLYAREKISYSIMKEAYNDVALVPDMVLRMNKCVPGQKRCGCILSLRSDREKTRSDETEKEIRIQVGELFGENIQELDMVVPHPVPVSERDKELEKQYDAFRHAELVITDRLHGMIFCAITGTPCIVINSKSPKVRGCYEWVKDLPYVQFCNDVSQITEIYHAIPKQDWQYDNTKLLPLYEPLIADIKAASRGR